MTWGPVPRLLLRLGALCSGAEAPHPEAAALPTRGCREQTGRQARWSELGRGAGDGGTRRPGPCQGRGPPGQ